VAFVYNFFENIANTNMTNNPNIIRLVCSIAKMPNIATTAIAIGTIYLIRVYHKLNNPNSAVPLFVN
jgi:hypothetical protein